MLRFFKYCFVLGLFAPWLVSAQDEDALQFVQNKGQFEKEVLFRVQLNTGYVFLERNAITFKLFNETEFRNAHRHLHEDTLSEEQIIHGHSFKYKFHNCLNTPDISGQKQFKQKFNYFLGNDKSKWASNVQLFSEVIYKEIYDGIDLKVYSKFGQIKYEWIVSPGTDVSQIEMELEGLDSIIVKENNLLLHTSIGVFPDKDLQVWQSITTLQKGISTENISCNYKFRNNRLAYVFPRGYNKNLPLVIDPILVFSTYSGSQSDNFGFTATFDLRGNLYAAGATDNLHGTYPVTSGAFQTKCKGGMKRSPVLLACDITISKYDSTGSNLLYATYIGGKDDDYPHSMVVNTDSDLVVFGTTYSTDFPMNARGYDTSHNSDTGKTIYTDIVVFKLSKHGDSLLGSTFFGGNRNDGLTSSSLRYNYADDFRGEVLTDKSNNVYVVSNTNSPDIPLKKSTKDTLEAGSDGLCLKFSEDLDQLLWATYFGGNRADAIYSLEFDKNENIYIAGGTMSTDLPTHSGALSKGNNGSVDGFMAVYKKDTFTLEKATYYGTSAYDQIYFLEIDKLGNIYATGQTEGNITPSKGVYTYTANSGQFILMADANLSTIKKQTVFGSYSNSFNLSPSAFLVDSCGNIYFSGWGETSGLPLTSGALQKTTDGQDFYLAVFGKNISSLLFATYFGGNKSMDHVDGGTSRFDKRGVIYQSVCSSCPTTNPPITISDFPTTSGAAFTKNVSYRCSNAAFKIDFQINNIVKAKFIPDSILCGPSDIQFTNKSLGNGQYKWNFGDSDTSRDKHPKHSYKDTGKYTIKLIAIDSNTCNFSDTTIEKITVYKKPTADFSIKESKCFKQVQIINKSKDYSVLDWDYGDGNKDQNPNPIIHYYDTGKFKITLITDAQKVCSDTAYSEFEIKEIIYVKAAFIPDTTLCGPAEIRFTNQSNSNGSFKWDFGDGTFSKDKHPIHTYPNTGKYTINLTVTDSTTCNLKDSISRLVNVLPRPKAEFDVKPIKCMSEVKITNKSKDYDILDWNYGDGNSNQDTGVGIYKYQSPGVYKIVLITNNKFCSDTASKTVEIKVNTYVKAAFIPDTMLCGPGNVQFTNQSDSLGTYKWDFGDGKFSTDSNPIHSYLTSGNFKVKLFVTDSLTCNVSDSISRSVNILEIPKAEFDVKLFRCKSEVEITNKSWNTKVLNWDYGDGNSDQNPKPGIYKYQKPGIYVITLISHNQICSDTISRSFEIKTNTYVESAFIPDTVLCGIGNVQFTNLSNGTGNFLWDFGDGNLSTDKNPKHNFVSLGAFGVKLIAIDTSTCNISDTALRTVNVVKQSHAGFITKGFDCLSQIEIINTGSDFETTHWDFGDGTISENEKPGRYEYKDSGTFFIRLITDANTLCPDTAYVKVNIKGSPSDKFIPINVFTPDGDGLNECFHFGGVLNECSEIRIIIYDRWGLKMFETKDFNSCWNGRIHNTGRECPEGTYFYICEYKGESGAIQPRFSGTVTLIRGK